MLVYYFYYYFLLSLKASGSVDGKFFFLPKGRTILIIHECTLELIHAHTYIRKHTLLCDRLLSF